MQLSEKSLDKSDNLIIYWRLVSMQINSGEKWIQVSYR